MRKPVNRLRHRAKDDNLNKRRCWRLPSEIRSYNQFPLACSVFRINMVQESRLTLRGERGLMKGLKYSGTALLRVSQDRRWCLGRMSGKRKSTRLWWLWMWCQCNIIWQNRLVFYTKKNHIHIYIYIFVNTAIFLTQSSANKLFHDSCCFCSIMICSCNISGFPLTQFSCHFL